MSFITSTGSQGKWMESIAENVETTPGHGGDEQPLVAPIKPPTLPRSWTVSLEQQAQEEAEEVATDEDSLSIRENVPEDVFYASKTVAGDFVKNTIDMAIIAVAVGGEDAFDSIDSDEYFEGPYDMIGEKMNEHIMDQWETEMDQYYRDQRDLCDIMD